MECLPSLLRCRQGLWIDENQLTHDPSPGTRTAREKELRIIISIMGCLDSRDAAANIIIASELKMCGFYGIYQLLHGFTLSKLIWLGL